MSARSDKALAFIRSEFDAGRGFPTRKRLAAVLDVLNLKYVDDVLLDLTAKGAIERNRRGPTDGHGHLMKGARYVHRLKEPALS